MGAFSRCHGVCLLHLPEDLGFADNQRVETRRHAKQVPCHVGAGVDVEMWGELLLGHVVEATHEPGEVVSSGLGVLAGGIDLGTVAGGQHHRFGRSRADGQLPERLGDTASGEIDALAQVDRRRVVADAQ